jgi:TolB protein
LLTSTAPGNADIVLLDEPGGTLVALTRDPAQDHWASWSPDGTRIVFQTLRDGQREIYAANADGSDPVNLSRHPDEDLLPEWSPDGRRILFFSTRDHERGPRGEFQGDLWLMDADGSNQTRLTSEMLTSSFGGAWAPDGASVILSRMVGEATDLFVLDVETGVERPLTRTPTSEGGARYSPDGTLLALTVSDSTGARIAVMGADGAGVRILTDGGADYYPEWSPDGQWILYTTAGAGGDQLDLWALPLAGGAPMPLVTTAADERKGSWRHPT